MWDKLCSPFGFKQTIGDKVRKRRTKERNKMKEVDEWKEIKLSRKNKYKGRARNKMKNENGNTVGKERDKDREKQKIKEKEVEEKGGRKTDFGRMSPT